MKQHALRLPDDVMDALNARAAETGLSRNEQIVRLLRDGLARPIKTRNRVVKEKT